MPILLKGTVKLSVLASTMLAARRIFQRVRQAITADYQGDDGSGEIGSGYLRGKQIKSVVVGEPRSATWDRQGRVKRVTADMVIEYLEEV